MTHFDSSASIERTFWRYAIPSIAAMLINGLYQIIDGIFVGNYIGAEGLAGVNMAWPVVCIVAALGLMVGMGSGSLMSMNKGKGNPIAAKSALSSGLWLLLSLGLISMGLLMAFGTQLLLAQGAQGNTLTLAHDYIDVFVYGGIFSLAATALPLLIRNDESPTFATVLMIVGAVINIVLDYVFIALFGWALYGAALATVIAQAIVTLLGIGYFFTRYANLKLSLPTLKFDLSLAIKAIVLGSSCLVMYLYTSFVIAIHNKLMMDYGSPTTVGAYAIVGYLMMIYYFLAQGIAEGVQPPVSYYFGAKQADNIRKMMVLGTKMVIVSGVVITVLLNVFPVWVTEFFSNNDTELVAQTKNGIHLHLLAMYLDGFIVLASVYFMAVNQGGKALAVSAGNMIVQLPFLYVMPKWLGLDGVWLAVPLSNVALFVIVAPLVWWDIKQRCHSTLTPTPSVAGNLVTAD